MNMIEYVSVIYQLSYENNPKLTYVISISLKRTSPSRESQHPEKQSQWSTCNDTKRHYFSYGAINKVLLQVGSLENSQ